MKPEKPRGLPDDCCGFLPSVCLGSMLMIGLHVKMPVTLGFQGLNEG